jgi:hypothetical protein
MGGAPRKRLTYANVMSTIAVFLVVAGGATALAAVLTKNSVKSRHIAPRAVKTSDLGRNAATGAKVREGSLAQVPSAAQANAAATAANAANAGLLDNIDSLGFARPARNASGSFTEGDPLSLDIPGYVNFTIFCDDAPSDTVLFSYGSDMGASALQFVTVFYAPSQASDGTLRIYGGEAGNGGQSNSTPVGSIIYRLQQPGAGKGVVVLAQAHEVSGDNDCQGSIQAFRIG